MAARGSLRESGKLIICLSDEDLKAMLQIKKEGEKTTGGYLEDILDDMLMRLEKIENFVKNNSKILISKAEF